jgi:hypothetical protein
LRPNLGSLRQILFLISPKINCKILKKSKSNQSSIFQSLLRSLLIRLRTLKNISELLRPFGRLPIGGWS